MTNHSDAINSDSDPLISAPFRSKLALLELCCGSANLCKAFNDVGLQAVGVDHSHNKQQALAPVVVADLSETSGRQLVDQLEESCAPDIVHAGPPCGTASRAREKRLPTAVRKQGAPEPRPLRSNAFPLGLSGLTAVEQKRVDAANEIYRYVLSKFIARHQQRKLFSLENPETSIFWLHPLAILLMSLDGVLVIDFAQCAHGGDRPVRRRWVTNIRTLVALRVDCPGVSATHHHKPFAISKTLSGWKFSTAEEATYPLLLCQRYRDYVIPVVGTPPNVADFAPSDRRSSKRPLSPEQQESDSVQHQHHKTMLRASIGFFIRGNKFPALVPEFLEKRDMQHPAAPGTRFVTPDGRQAKILKSNGDQAAGSQLDTKEISATVGLYRTPAEFIQVAKETRHPIDMHTFLPECVVANIFYLLTTAPEIVAKERLSRIQQMRAWALELRPANDEILKAMPPQQAHVVQDKHFALLKKMIEHIDYPDKTIVDDLIRGTLLTGEMPASHVFPRRSKPAALSAADVLSSSSLTRKSVIDRTSSSGDPEIDKAVWEETVAECNKGWVSESLTLQELEDRLGPDFVVARRFGIRQGGKIRCIDDYSISGTNATVTTKEKLDLYGTDEIFAMLKLIISSVDSSGCVHIKLPSGSILSGRIPRGRTAADAMKWLGKTFDLKAAYRQIAVSQDPENLKFSVIAVYNPITGKVDFRTQYATAFGSVASVYIFNRAARALWAIGCWLFIVWGNYFDDYPTLEPEATTLSAELAIRAMCSLLGWNLCLDETKNKPFGERFPMLGIITCLERLPSAEAVADNKPERMADIRDIVESILSSKSCPKPLMAELRGKCQYAAAHVAGRLAVGVLAGLSEHQHRTLSDRISAFTELILKRLLELIANAKPRTLNCTGSDKPVLVFTDGACEESAVTIGAVIIDVAEAFKPFMWGCEVHAALVARWKSEGSLQVIGQTELLPIVLVKYEYKQLFRHRRIIFFIDNDAARCSMVNGYSPSMESNRLIQFATATDQDVQCWCWYTRVPSTSNPADAPSRLELKPSKDNAWASVVPAPDIPASLL